MFREIRERDEVGNVAFPQPTSDTPLSPPPLPISRTGATGPAVGLHPHGVAVSDTNVDGRPDCPSPGTTTEEWDARRKEDFDADDLATIDDHFPLSASGFPPDAVAHPAIPVVDPDGNPNRNAVATTSAGAHGVAAVRGIDDGTVGQARGIVRLLARETFDHGSE